MQAWLFLSDFWTADRVKSYLSKVPIVRHRPVRHRSIETAPLTFQGHLILLDLFSEAIPQYSRFESFYGHFYIWNMLHDFGGNNFLYGSLINVTNVILHLAISRIVSSRVRLA